MNPWTRVDFDKLVQEVKQSRCGKADLSIWGGRCTESDLQDFIRQWPLDRMPYRIWAYASEIAFGQDTLPPNVALLERGRLFGEGGDLEVRRDGGEFAWRFIGPAGVRPPTTNRPAEDFWSTHPDATFYRRRETALLWGKWDGNRWREDRVGAACLEYPAPAGWPRVQVEFWTFSRAGRVEFVWYTGLSEWKEDDNG